MKLRDRIDKLHSHVDSLEVRIKESNQDTEENVLKFNEPDIKDKESIISSVHSMLETIKKSGMYHKEQAEIIKNIVPPISDYLDLLLKNFEDNRLKINDEYENDFIKMMQQVDFIPMKRIEEMEKKTTYLVGLDEKINEIITITYDSFVGMLNFIEDKK